MVRAGGAENLSKRLRQDRLKQIKIESVIVVW